MLSSHTPLWAAHGSLWPVLASELPHVVSSANFCIRRGHLKATPDTISHPLQKPQDIGHPRAAVLGLLKLDSPNYQNASDKASPSAFLRGFPKPNPVSNPCLRSAEVSKLFETLLQIHWIVDAGPEAAYVRSNCKRSSWEALQVQDKVSIGDFRVEEK